MAGIGDGSDRFFNQEYDNPDLRFVSQLLTGDNYSSWRREMHIALLIKDKFFMVDGSTPIPDDMALEPGQYRKWLEDNNLVISWLLNNMSLDIIDTVACRNSAAEIWKDLKDRFKQRSALSLFRLKKELMSLTQGKLTVDQYHILLKVLWEEMNDERPLKECTCGAMRPLLDHLEKELVVQFLVGLNDEFADVRGKILSMEPLPPINEVYSLVVQQENEIKKSLVCSCYQSKNAYANAKNQNLNR